MNAGNIKSDNADIAQLQKRLDKATNELKKLSENSLKSSKASLNAAGFDIAFAFGDGGKLAGHYANMSMHHAEILKVVKVRIFR